MPHPHENLQVRPEHLRSSLHILTGVFETQLKDEAKRVCALVSGERLEEKKHGHEHRTELGKRVDERIDAIVHVQQKALNALLEALPTENRKAMKTMLEKVQTAIPDTVAFHREAKDALGGAASSEIVLRVRNHLRQLTTFRTFTDIPEVWHDKDDMEFTVDEGPAPKPNKHHGNGRKPLAATPEQPIIVK